MTTFFLNSSPKTSKYELKHFQSQIQIFLFFYKSLQLDKVEGAGFKYDKIFLDFLPKNTQIRYSFSQIQAFLFFCKVLQVDKLDGADFKYDNCIFLIPVQKYPNQAFLGRKFNDFYFCTKLWNKTNSRISNMTTEFSKYSAKIYKLGIFVPKLKDFYFPLNFAIIQIRGH